MEKKMRKHRRFVLQGDGSYLDMQSNYTILRQLKQGWWYVNDVLGQPVHGGKFLECKQWLEKTYPDK